MADTPNRGQVACLREGPGHTVTMVAWKDVEQAEPDFAARGRRLFEAGPHQTIAALRAHGPPPGPGPQGGFACGELPLRAMAPARPGAEPGGGPRGAPP